MNFEKELDRHIINWEKYKLSHSGPLKQVRQTYIAETKKKRRLSLTKDLYLSICVFLNMSDMINLTTLCKEFMNYYPDIWRIIQYQKYPYSIIPDSDYLSIRHSIAMKIWLDVLHDYNFDKSKSWKEIEEDDRLIKLRTADLLHLKNTYPGYEGCMYAKNTHLGEICAMKKTRESSYDKLNGSVIDLIDSFKFCSETDFTGEKYMTIKPEIDMRLFGFDINTKKGKKHAEDCKKWLSGEYNSKHDYQFDIHEPHANDIYVYDYDDDGDYYRFRRTPIWWGQVFPL